MKAWKWSGAALYLLEKHQGPDERVKSPVDEAEYRCLWWSCFIRDQLMSLASQQSPRMAFSPSRVSMISDHDLGSLGISENWNVSHNIEPVDHLRSLTENQTLATLFIERAKLSVILNQFSRGQRQSNGRYRMTSLLPGCDKPSTTGEETVAQLLLWYCSLDNNARYSQGTDYNPNNGSSLQDGLLPFYQALLLIPYYLTLIKANFHDKSECCNDPQSASKRVLYARQEVSRLLQDLIKGDRLKHIPTDLVECLLPFATTVLLEKTSTPSASREPMSNRIEGFKQCLQVMRVMMANDRLQPQNDYRISLLGATCSLYAGLEERPRDLGLGGMARNTMPFTGTDILDAAVSSTKEIFSDCSFQWQSPRHDDMQETSLLNSVRLNDHQPQLNGSNEQTFPSDSLIDRSFSEDVLSADDGALAFS
ncbi:hypothetical protein LTR84_001587 [Exophiala bonariae]|uniref:Transcription factor domain-containing protein n=1 Tax=Exophiala bonariae TaxID=1690606 RepID=A0AAV9ND04_9EURO|nr:hypothetical protein LTR84_001587 [Exophiala bonariae]